MKVEVIEKTKEPEKLICTAARGDYFDGFVGETDYDELMESVSYYDEDVADRIGKTEARTKAFLEKQLSRGHFGPWEHPQITISVKGVSRVTMAQLTRHRHMTFDVQSQRYVDFSDKNAVVPKSLYDPEHFTRETGEIPISEDEQDEWREKYVEYTEEAYDLYEEMVDNGIPKEDARFLLPIGTPVNMTFSGNARTFLHVLNLRQRANSQWEVRQLSNKIVDELEDWIPYTTEWWEKNGPVKISP